MGIYYDITNPDASYEWLYSILNIKKGRFISNYVLECNNDFDVFFVKHLDEIEAMDINQLELVVIHVTTNGNDCAEIRKNGLRDLKRVLHEKTELSMFLNDRGINFDIQSKVMHINGETFDVDYEKYKNLYRSDEKAKVLYKIGHKIYYDYQVNGFFFCRDIYDYGTIHKAPEFLFTLSGFGQETAEIDDEWEKITKPYVVKYRAKIADFEYFTFYESEEKYLQDFHNKWLGLKRWLLQKAIESAFSGLASEIFAYIKQGKIIESGQILDCVPAEQWRKDIFRYYK